MSFQTYPLLVERVAPSIPRAAVEDVLRRHRERLQAGEGLNARSYRAVEELAQLWGRTVTHAALEVALSANPLRIDFFNAPLHNVVERLEILPLSPDRRLNHLVKMAKHEPPPGSDGMELCIELARRVDAESGLLSAGEFDDAWHEAVAHSSFDRVLAAVLRALGRDVPDTPYGDMRAIAAEMEASPFDLASPSEIWRLSEPENENIAANQFTLDGMKRNPSLWFDRQEKHKRLFLSHMRRIGVLE